jgi:riboflavin kinase / FMN adenylyltransferase
MQVHFGVELLRAEWPSAVVCIGTFDGVHLGHRAVISAAVDQAREQELPAILLTFDRHPAAVLAPDRCPKPISPLSANLATFEELGVALAVVLRFGPKLSQTSAGDFLQQVLLDKLRASCVVVGHDFAMGRGREGTTTWLAERISTTVLPPYEIEGARVSSSAIRAAVAEGRVAEAARLLGRPFEIQGVVVPGQRLGRQLGYPTANLARSFDGVLPADGVYAGRARTPMGDYEAAIGIGVRPTVGGGPRTIEAYLIDYPGDSLYGRPVALEIHHRIREEQHFDSLEALKERMALDVEESRRLLTFGPSDASTI